MISLKQQRNDRRIVFSLTLLKTHNLFGAEVAGIREREITFVISKMFKIQDPFPLLLNSRKLRRGNPLHELLITVCNK
jgi:hypothetical protein